MVYSKRMELYHVLNRGVDGRDLFLDNTDRVRFVHDLFEFNDGIPAPHARASGRIGGFVNPHMREKIVDMHGWCVMKNHYHLLLSERVEGGLTLFLRKLNVGYANYFNERHHRTGTLFQGRTKKILIARDAHFLYILNYIHLNPLDYLKGAEDWRLRSKTGVRSLRTVLEYLKTYRWSSYLDYTGKKNFPSLITTSFFNNSLGEYTSNLNEYLKGARDVLSPALFLE